MAAYSVPGKLGQKPIFLKSEACRLFSRDSGINIGDGDSTYLYGMSKMTVSNESKDFYKYN